MTNEQLDILVAVVTFLTGAVVSGSLVSVYYTQQIEEINQMVHRMAVAQVNETRLPTQVNPDESFNGTPRA